MKKKVIENKKSNQSVSQKAFAYFIALTLGLSNNAYAQGPINYESKTYTPKIEKEIDQKYYAVQALYQNQMNYIHNTLLKLNEFYINQDTNNLIKNNFPEAFQVANYDFNYDYIDYGTHKYFMPKIEAQDTNTYINLISKNNYLIHALNIKPIFNIPELKLINIKLFREKSLINEYTRIVKSYPLVNNNLLIILSCDPSELTQEDICLALEDIVINQTLAIKRTQNHLKYIYSNKNIEKNPAIYTDLDTDIYYNGIKFSIKNDNELSTEDLINKYITLIKRNNSLIEVLNIKSLEDEVLIKEHTSIVNNLNMVPEDVIIYLENIINEKTQKAVKTYENK